MKKRVIDFRINLQEEVSNDDVTFTEDLSSSTPGISCIHLCDPSTILTCSIDGTDRSDFMYKYFLLHFLKFELP